MASSLIGLFGGAPLASAVYPVRQSIYQSRCWLRLFCLMFALTAIGAVIIEG
jgi:hypothetical protein